MTADEFNHLCDAAFGAHMPDFEPYAGLPRERLMELMEEATRADPGSAFLSAATAVRGRRQAGRLGPSGRGSTPRSAASPWRGRTTRPSPRKTRTDTVPHSGGSGGSGTRRSGSTSGTRRSPGSWSWRWSGGDRGREGPARVADGGG